MSRTCQQLHRLFASLEPHTFPFDAKKIPTNGIYILYETGERGHGSKRIVRIGSHTGKDQLLARLRQHFVNEIKDRSVFRKNIGRALLNRYRDPYLEQWNKDLTSTASKKKYSTDLDSRKQKAIERRVSDYLRNRFKFVVFGVPKKRERLRYETKLITTISKCNVCRSSDKWLGRYSPIVKISSGKLWQVKDLDGTPLTRGECSSLRKLVAGK